ncbi:Putative SET domain, Zinc finger, PHD-type, Zinc finger, FYVE/PHD-type [Septoria linicola]|uniref:SET domain, Zinc finger, PHD-type, Zinc finger, FYVE/PHD-type n=1 Tax=Septoria linicola TaxID=215465 RepID=A0A9Q9ELB9_9PEZI|nr:Putative SET domain, Zinc finger, PHD-type, Zinc finger, FYVE/PHD-type [Septoria linicola]
MNETSPSVQPINGHGLSHHPACLHATSNHPQRYHAPIVNGDPEDDGQISCICGFADDDGWTVACDKCNRWQHQSCYYPQYDERQLPEHLQHYCVECEPRPVDVAGARRRQLAKREPTEPLTNGIKRTASKSHKKKVKEPVTAYTNGWPIDKLRNDRTSASPRDQPPPAKRPKTSHRTSDSTTTTSTKGHSRKRNASTANHRRSLSRSPDSPIERYSENFLQSYTPDDWSVTDNNLHDSLQVTHSLSEWVDMHEDDFEEEHGQVKGEALMRYDGDLDNMPGKALLEIVSQQDEGVSYRGNPASWKMITVQEPLPNGSYIGEIKGRICFKKDYQEEPANRWAEMRHPEPFVFFHSRLPIALDARNEGTDLRYVRRSCYPNARLQILITGVADYHFCLLATEEIRPGEEIAIGWETTEGMPHLMKNNLTHDDLEHLTTWVSTVLANCGPCACGRQTEEPEQNDACCMARFDRRLAPGDERPTKTVRVKKRKNGQHVSPMNTNTVNSRSGSEARKIEPEDDGTDSRSASGSAGRGSVSRDITPNTHYSGNGTVMPELSEREKKKMAKEEEMFRRQEEESTGKQGKKKRNSGGSSLNTPSITSSKQLGFPTSLPSKPVEAPRQASQSAKSMLGRKTKTQKSITKAPSRVLKRPRPNYVEASTQCDLDAEEDARRATTPTVRKPFKSRRQTLLERCARNNHAIFSTAPTNRTPARQSPPTADVMDIVQSGAAKSPSPSPVELPQPVKHTQETETGAPVEDIEMADTHDEATKEEPLPDAHTAVSSTPEGSEPMEKRSSPSEPSPAPPWSAKGATGAVSDHSSKPAAMRIDMPPPATLSSTLSSSGTFTNGVGSVAQSPASMTPSSIFPPSVAAAVAPSPAKKKLSLSDYTRRKARKEDSDMGNRESSPASVASGPVVPPLQPSSSVEARAAEGNALEEDIKMEEATAVENVPPTVTAA